MDYIRTRVRGEQEVRTFYVYAIESTIHLFNTFQKKTQKTPKKELLKDPKAKREYDELEAEFQIARSIIQA